MLIRDNYFITSLQKIKVKLTGRRKKNPILLEEILKNGIRQLFNTS